MARDLHDGIETKVLVLQSPAFSVPGDEVLNRVRDRCFDVADPVEGLLVSFNVETQDVLHARTVRDGEVAIFRVGTLDQVLGVTRIEIKVVPGPKCHVVHLCSDVVLEFPLRRIGRHVEG